MTVPLKILGKRQRCQSRVSILGIAGFTAATLAFSVSAHAQSRYVQISASTQYDDNLRRLPDDRKSEAPHDGSEFATLVSADAGIATTISLLNFRVDGNVAKRFFAYNDELNNEEYRLAAAADYTAQSGSAAIEALISRQNLGFTDPIFRGTNIRELSRVAAEGDRRIFGDIRLAGTARLTSSSSPDRELSRADNKSFGYSIGLAYVSPLGNRVTVGYDESRSNGTNDAPVVDEDPLILYSGKAISRSAFARILYVPSVALSFDARVGYTWRDDQSFLDADFKGVTYAGSLRWAPLESVRVVASANRSFSSNNELFANGVQSTSYSLEATAVAAGRVSLTSSVRHDERNFRYDLQGDDTVTFGPRTDRFWVFQAGANYMTGIDVAVGLNFSHVRINDSVIPSTIVNNAVILTLSRRFNL